MIIEEDTSFLEKIKQTKIEVVCTDHMNWIYDNIWFYMLIY